MSTPDEQHLVSPQEINRAAAALGDDLIIDPPAPDEWGDASRWVVTYVPTAERLAVEERPPHTEYPTPLTSLWVVLPPPQHALPLGALMYLRSSPEASLSGTYTYNLYTDGSTEVYDFIFPETEAPLPQPIPTAEELLSLHHGNVWLAAAHSSSSSTSPSSLTLCPRSSPTADEEERMTIMLRDAVSWAMARMLSAMDPATAGVKDAAAAAGAFVKLLKEWRSLAPVPTGAEVWDEVRLEREIRSITLRAHEAVPPVS